MDSRDWLILKILYDKKNITKAAETLYVSQPALTNRLQQIEKEFGVSIVTRGRRGISFTPQGEYLVQCADEILLKIEKIKETLWNMNDDVVGTLKLGVSRFMMKNKLPALLKLFKTEYPKVEFKIITDWSSDIFNSLTNKDVHIGLLRGDYNWKSEKHLLFEENICIVSKNSLDIENLPNLPRIDYQTDHLLKSLIDNWWAENFSQGPLVSMNVDQLETCKEMVINDLGYGIMPSMVVNKTNDLYIINLANKNGTPLIRKTWMFYEEETLKLNVVKAFVNFIKKFDLQEM
jgi:DNA-binding transcriptional LysR family regulator